MGFFGKTYAVRRTIFPYDDGYGVLITQFGKSDIVYCHGLSKGECNTIIEELKKSER